MNEQLIVKNFGPIKDATVDFKRVTVFIGPTGGGKSTLAKLAAILRDVDYSFWEQRPQKLAKTRSMLTDFNLKSFSQPNSVVFASYGEIIKHFDFKHDKLYLFGDEIEDSINKNLEESEKLAELVTDTLKQAVAASSENSDKAKELANMAQELLSKINSLFDASKNINSTLGFTTKPVYILSERIFVPTIEYSWAGLMRDDIGLPKLLLDFSNSFSLARKDIKELEIPFFNVKYMHIDGRDFIKIPEREEPLMLLETASGIQSVTPLLVLLEHLSRNTEQSQSFIIEEPELNLYPTAQQGLLNWLVEKCTQGENDLTITTHSPYILSHLNLLLYAYQVAEKHPDRREAVAAIVPEASWINPKEFACYQVENGGVQSLVDEELGLIDNNELDGLSGDAADAFDNLIRLSKGFAIK